MLRPIARPIRWLDALAELTERFGPVPALRIALQLRLHDGRPLRYAEAGRQYVMPKDRAARYHLLESLPKLRRLAALVRADDRVVVDVGAHSGLFAAYAKERAPGAFVLCVEADATLVPIIRRNLAPYVGWDVTTAAVTDAGGEATLYRSAFSTQTSSLVAEAAAISADETPVVVPATTLDDLCARFDRVDVLKVDVQGAEERVLAGAEATLARTRTVLIELAFQGADPLAVADRLIREFGPWRTINPVLWGADVVFERER